MGEDIRRRQARFDALYAAHLRPVLGFAVRRARQPADAADVVAEVFLVAWRRLDDVPPGDRARLWLYGVARGVLANQRRAAARRSRLGDRLAGAVAVEIGPTPPSRSAPRRWPGPRWPGCPTTTARCWS